MDELDTLRGLRAGVAASSADTLHEQRDRLLAEATGSPRRWSWLRRRWPRPHRLWIPALAGGLTLALLVGVFGVLLTQGPPALSPPDPDQWFYRHTVTSVDAQVSEDEQESETFETEGWTRADLQETATRGEDGELTRASETAALGTFFDDTQDLYDFYRSLLDDPDSRLDTINEHIADQVDQSIEEGQWSEDRARTFLTLDLVRIVLMHAAPPPDVQTALYQALRDHPDFDDDGSVPDASGRDSIALGTQIPSLLQDADSETRQQFLFHPDTHTFHGWRAENSRQVSSQAVLATGIVDQPDQTP